MEGEKKFTPETIAHCSMTVIEESFLNFSKRCEGDFEIHMTEILHLSDPRAPSPMMTTAKKTEIKSLSERGTLKIILRGDLPPDGNVLPGRFFAFHKVHRRQPDQVQGKVCDW